MPIRLLMDVSLNLPLVIGLAGMLAGLLMATLSMGLSRLPVWRHGRRFALVAVTSAGYCAFDLAMVLGRSPSVVAAGVQAALLCGVAHGVAWLWYLAALEGRALNRFERVLAVGGLLTGVVGLIPGAIVTREIVAIHVPWFGGAVYRTPQPTVIGAVLYAYFALMLTGVAVRAAQHWPAGDRARSIGAGVAFLGLLGVNDTLVSAGQLNMPLLLDAGSVVVVLFAGLASQRHLAEELTHAQQAVARTERLVSLSRLATGIAHEINNPAAVIQYELAQIVRDGDDTPRHVEHARTAVDRIVYVVRQLLDLGLASRPGSAALAPFAVAPVVERAAAAVGTRFTSGALVLDVEPDLSAFGDPLRVQAVLVILLSNAAHAVERGTEPRASVRATRERNRVQITVTDNGPGLPPAVVNRLFEPFVNAKPFGQGAGLGLAVANGLMHSQSGRLQLVRTGPRGTEFSLDLPLTSSAGHETAPVSVSGASDMRTLGLLIIDDDPDLRLVLQEAAEAYRFRAVAAATVADAFHLIESGAEVDVVLCDLMMPDGGADTWLRQCRKAHPDLAARTIVITGGPTSAEAVALADANPDRLLYKPFAMAEVRAIALRLMNR